MAEAADIVVRKTSECPLFDEKAKDYCRHPLGPEVCSWNGDSLPQDCPLRTTPARIVKG